MSASLVGSEMCIRDRRRLNAAQRRTARNFHKRTPACNRRRDAWEGRTRDPWLRMTGCPNAA
eukprot:10224735-Alexandrium_andersonii.AAC.1